MAEVIQTSKKSIEELKTLAAKKKEELKKEEQEELIKLLSVRERLERKLHTDEVVLKLSDDLGEFSLRFRKLNPVEHDELARLIGEVASNPKTVKETSHAMLKLISSACLEPELDLAYWEAGTGFSGDVLNTAILRLKEASTLPDRKYLEEIYKFRGK